MKQKFLQGFICFLSIFFLGSGLSFANGPQHEFVGAMKCKMCHQKPEQGEQYRIWQESKHAHALDSLATPEAKEIAAKMGIADPQKDGKCLKCHSTAYGFSEVPVTTAIAVEEAISCESCHGAGKDYMKKSIMEDEHMAVANGLVIPDENVCKKCHNPEAPTFKGFDFKQMWEKIKHPVPQK